MQHEDAGGVDGPVAHLGEEEEEFPEDFSSVWNSYKALNKRDTRIEAFLEASEAAFRVFETPGVEPITGLLFMLALKGPKSESEILSFVEFCSEAMASVPGQPDFYVQMGNVLKFMEVTPFLADTPLHAHFVDALRHSYINANRINDAIDLLLHWQQRTEQHPELRGFQAEAWFDLAGLYRVADQFSKCTEAFQNFIDIAESLPRSSRDLVKISSACTHLGRHTEALDVLKEALSLPSTDTNSILLGMSIVYKELSDYQAALLLLEQVMLGTDENDFFRIVVYVHQANVQMETASIPEVADSYKQGLELATRWNQPFAQVYFHRALRDLYRGLAVSWKRSVAGNFLAEKWEAFSASVHHNREFLKALGTISSNHPAVQFDALFQSADLQHGIGSRITGIPRQSEEEDLAIESELLERLAFAKCNNLINSEASAYSELCEFYIAKGKWENAKDAFNKNIACMRHMERVGEKINNLLLDLGLFALQLGELHKAEELLQQFLLRRENVMIRLVNTDKVALQVFENAKYAYMKMVEVQMLLHEADPTKSDHLLKALVWAERSKARVLMSNFASCPSLLAAQVGCQTAPSPDSITNVEAGADRDHHPFFIDDNYALNCILQGQEDKVAFVEYTFLSRELLLVHLISKSGASVQDINMCLINLSKVFDEATQKEAQIELDSLLQTVRRGALVQNGETSKQVEELDNNVVYAMNRNRDQFFSSVIVGLVAKIHRLTREAQKKLASGARKGEVEGEQRNLNTILEALYGAIIQPFEVILGKLTPEHTIVFIPHEDLGVVPFAALCSPDGKHLIEKFAVCISPSIWCTCLSNKIYQQMLITPARPELVVGKQSGYPKGWNDLTEANKEVEGVLKYCSNHAISLKGVNDESIKGVVKKCLQEVSWAHLAVHGSISLDYPRGSLLLGANDDIDRLTADEISSSGPLPARAIVLSACQTALGSISGEGIIGFARAFILAGVPSTILSMWEVEQTFCREFMNKFYEELQSGQDIAHSLQRVIVSMMQEQQKAIDMYALMTKRAHRKKVENVMYEKRWKIWDWAAFSCFGLPNVMFPNSKLMDPTSSEYKTV